MDIIRGLVNDWKKTALILSFCNINIVLFYFLAGFRMAKFLQDLIVVCLPFVNVKDVGN